MHLLIFRTTTQRYNRKKSGKEKNLFLDGLWMHNKCIKRYECKVWTRKQKKQKKNYIYSRFTQSLSVQLWSFATKFCQSLFVNIFCWYWLWCLGMCDFIYSFYPFRVQCVCSSFSLIYFLSLIFQDNFYFTCIYLLLYTLHINIFIVNRRNHRWICRILW